MEDDFINVLTPPIPSRETSDTAVPSPALSSVPSSEDLQRVEDEIAVSSSSDSDSDSEIFLLPCPPSTSMSSASLATVLANPKTVPVLTAGKIRPETLTDWVHKCRQYFKTARKIPSKDYVLTAAMGLQDPLVQDWYMNAADELDVLSFDDFVVLMKKRWLKSGWEDELVTEIIRCRQREPDTFEDWVVLIEKKNTLLKGSSGYFDEVRLRAQIAANAVDDLREAANLENVRSIKDFKEWKEALVRVDAQRLKDRARIEARVNAILSAHSASKSRASKLPSASSSSSSRNARPPALTEDEKRILQKHNGCFKCRRLDANHRSSECPNGFPSGVNYKPVVEPSGTAAPSSSSSSSKPRPQVKVAAISDVTNTYAEDATETIVAASCVLDDGAGYTDSEEYVLPSELSDKHILWSPIIHAPSRFSDPLEALIDDGCPTVLIRDDVVSRLGLRRFKIAGCLVLGSAWGKKQKATEWVKLKVSSEGFRWTSCVVRAVIVQDMFVPLILGKRWLHENKIVVDYEHDWCIHKPTGIDIRNLSDASLDDSKPSQEMTEMEKKDEIEFLQRCLLVRQHRDVARELELRFHSTDTPEPSEPPDTPSSVVASIRDHIELMATREMLAKEDAAMRARFADCFAADIPPLHRLPDTVHHRIRLKDADMTIRRRTYDCPKKYLEAWQRMIGEHIEGGRLRPSDSPYASPCFMIPKADPNADPRWVNDFRRLNANTIPDAHTLPTVQSILADCAKGKIWAKIDMTNTFFQTRVHPDDIKYTAVSTPFSLYEWTVMPQGLCNAPATHQR